MRDPIQKTKTKIANLNMMKIEIILVTAISDPSEIYFVSDEILLPKPCVPDSLKYRHLKSSQQSE